VTPVSVTATDSSPTATLSFSDGGSLPTGLSINVGTGAITGTPTTGGVFDVTITATDSAGFADSASFTWSVTNVLTPAVIGNQTAQSGHTVSPVFTAPRDSSSTATFSFTGGSTLPTGLSLNGSTGAVTGTPTTAGRYAVVITATDSAGFTATTSFTWTINNVVTVTAPQNVTNVTGSPIAPVSLPATDSSTATAITGWSATGLPPGIAIDPLSGALHGTPTTAGDYYSVTVTASDGAGFSGKAHFEWVITNSVVVAPIADQSAHTAYAVTPITPTATDSQVTPAVTFSWSATGLPSGIAIDHTSGVLSGTPTAPGSYAVTLTASDSATPSQSGSVSFTWTVTTLPPVVTAVAPASGPGAGGTVVRITGTDLQATSTVLFGSTPGTAVQVNASGTQVTVTSPLHGTGAVDVTVTTPGGTSSTSAADRFTFIGPTITSISRTSGPAVGGAKIKIVGTGLSGATAVLFGSVPATGVKINKAGTQLTALIPAGAPGPVYVTVQTPVGETAASSADQYTYLGPAVISLSKTGGPATGGTAVTITGSGLNGATGVNFGTTTVTTFTVNNAGTKLKVLAPAGTGTVDVTVTTPAATSAVVSSDRYTYG